MHGFWHQICFFQQTALDKNILRGNQVNRMRQVNTLKIATHYTGFSVYIHTLMAVHSK